jgi:hypothetical protein
MPRLGLRLARAGGREDWLRILLTLLGSSLSTVALLAAGAVAAMTGDLQFRVLVLNQPGLRFGVVITLLLLALPCLVFTGISARVGTPSRDRRLAALRMVGATPAQARAVVLWEVALTTALGALVGLLAFVVIITMARDRLVGAGDPTRWTDFVSLRAVVLGLVALAAVPGIGTLATALTLRRVTLSPFGASRRQPTRPLVIAPAVIFAVGALGLGGYGLLNTTLGSRRGLLIALALFVVTLLGLLLGAAAMSYLIGQLIAKVTGRPSLLIAGRRMIAQPYHSSRATASVLLGALLGSTVLGFKANFLTLVDPSDPSYAQTFRLLEIVMAVGITLAAAGLLVVQAESLVARRRVLTSLVAAGTPRRVLASSALFEAALPTVPCVLLATAAGFGASLGMLGRRGYTYYPAVNGRPVELAVPIPWGDLFVLAGGTIAVVVVMAAASLLVLAPSTRAGELRSAT